MFYLIFTSFIWAFSYGLIKVKLGNLDANFVTACRMLIASMVFLPFLRIKRLEWPTIFKLLWIGAIQYGLMYLCFLRSFRYLDAYQAALFTTMTPIYVVLFNDWFNKKFNFYYLKIALLAVLGGMVIYYKSINQNQILNGFVLVQLSDICFAFGQVAYKRLRTKHSELKDQNIYALLFIGALLSAIIATTAFDTWHNAALVTGQQLNVLLYLGAIASGLCFFWWNKGAVLTNTATLAVFNNLKSPLAITVSLIFFHEQADLTRLLIGLSLIGLALFLAEKHARQKIAYVE